MLWKSVENRPVPFALALLLVFAAQLQSQSQAPVFRSGVDRIGVDFLALASDGRPVADLKPEEVVLKVDGKVREIRSLEFLKLAPVEVKAETTLTPSLAVPAPFGSNAPAEAGRAIIIVFHHTSLQPGDERLVKDSVVSFIKTLTPRDRVALVTFQAGKVEVDLTTDHERVLKALPSITGRAARKDALFPTAGDALAAAERYAPANLVKLFGSFSGIDGPKTILFISGGLPASNDQGRDANSMAMEYQDVGKAAGKIGAHLYIIMPHSLGGTDAGVKNPGFDENGFTSVGFQSSVGSGLEQLAGVTGGALFQAVAGAPRVFERISRESSAYYLLGFDATSSERNGKSHKIAVSVARRGVSIRARPEFTIEPPARAPKVDPKNAAPAPTGPKTLLSDLKAYRDLPLRAVAYTFRSTSQGKVLVLVSAQSPGGTKLTAASFALIDTKGNIVTQWDADDEDLAKSPVVTAMNVTAGQYRLRAAAADADGHQGAVDYEFSATLTKTGTIALGGLMLGYKRGTEFAPMLDFHEERSATAYIEVYYLPTAGQTATVTMELAATADGPARLQLPAAITATKEPDRWIATAELPLTDLPSGDFVVRAIARVGDTAAGTVVRTLRKR